MALLSPVLDHIVIDVRDRIDEAMRCFSSLGFQLIPRGSRPVVLDGAARDARFRTTRVDPDKIAMGRVISAST